MCENVNRNPFAKLFANPNDAVSFSPSSAASVENVARPAENAVEESAPVEKVARPTENTVEESATVEKEAQPAENMVEESAAQIGSPVEESENGERDERLDSLLRNVFGISLSSEPCEKHKRRLVYVDTDSIEHALFERLMLDDVESRLIPATGTKGWACDSHTLQREIIVYLFECFCRLQRYKRRETTQQIDNLQALVLRNAATAMQEPDLFPGNEIHAQFLTLFAEGSSSAELSSFTAGIIAEMSSDGGEPDEASVTAAFGPVLEAVHIEAAKLNLLTYRQYWFDVLHTFASVEALAKLIVRHSSPKSGNSGRAYSDTLLGALFSLSCLPKTMDAPYEFFDKPLRMTGSVIDGNIWTALDALTESLHLVFHSLLKCSPEVRHLTLRWLGSCLDANASRGKLWSAQNEIAMGAILSVSDGFMLNLGTVLLRLCQPFCAKPNDTKVPKIDPTYCAVEAKDEEESRKRGLHMRGMSSETCLIPTSEDETRPHAESFGFVTECFFLTHRALDLGYRVVLDKLIRTNQDVARIQRLYNEAQGSEQQASSVLDVIVQRMEMEMTKALCLRASLRVPGLLNLLAKFHATTAFWLLQVNLDIEDEGDEQRSSYAPRKYVNVSFPLPERVPSTLRCVPEFVVENTVGFLCFLRLLSPNTFEEQGASFLNPILTEIIALMESPRRLYNPHLRARLAEGLEALLPTNDEAAGPAQSSLGTLHREMLFVEHPHRHQIVANLLEVFVSIEMTGQSVQFEQKFNYRRPMYIVMDYLWKLDEHRNNFRNLAEEAEQNMEAVQPPLFLRFINLLMNDAVFLLDEALSNMAQLKQMHQARENGEWNKLPQHERDQQASYLQHIGMIARFDNILGRETINMLKMLTTEIKSIFCHPTMVDRIASMLNYLLLQLVGPNNRNLKVKDQKEYDFNPANLVLNICEIYINLSQSENFTLAVSQDGRSYSSELFKLAENVLVRIGGVGILGDLDNFAKRVEEAAHVKREEDEILNNAPDDFLDPIMSTLMTDPVILPSSKITVDRQTIARHLLSDQTDPFNRSPLTMDRVQSNTELRSQIEEWIRQKKLEKSSASAQQP